MNYSDLKDFLENWLKEQPEGVPIPLNMKHSYSRDIRKAIEVNIHRIDVVPRENRNKNAVCRASYHRLVAIKTAIDKKSHDISEFGWIENNNYNK